MSQSGESVLEVSNLRVSYTWRSQASHLALNGLSFRMSGEAVGLVGESGSGKTSLALAIGGLLPENARVESGSIVFRGKNLLGMSEQMLRRIRGAEISFIFQEPATALNPVVRVGDQIAEVIRAHNRRNRPHRQTAVQALLRSVHLPDTDRFCRSYPHEISGGQRQRVVIAQALACRPSLLIADEPTTALDAITQTEILGLFKELRTQMGLSILLITHAPAALAGLVDRLIVMRAGKVLEEGGFWQVCRRPAHSYTRSLLGPLRGNGPAKDLGMKRHAG